jgi:D-beta-D-heptose 7-phosphate kinase/D-beta-D-heptose 1-phosphate adenosyltransferase
MRIIVIGEICEDVFVYGESKRLSPEAPVPVFIPKYTTINNGMCGNVMENLKGLVPDADVNYVPQQAKITKTRYVDDKTNYMFLRVDDGEGDVSPLKLNGYIRKLIEKSDITIVSDYNKGFLTDDVLVEIGQLSKLSIIDSKRNLTDAIVESYTFIKLNEEEFSVNKKLSEKYLNKMVVTLGMKGAMYNNVNYPSPSPKQTIDVSGAGDTFVASFITKIYETDDISDSIKFANEMASIVVSKRGVATPF